MTLPADNDARQRAIETLDRHLFLDAGAGCGKTRVLVDRYIHILATQGLSPRQIYAATFTKKAAAEMKERVRGECVKLAARADGARWQRIARELEAAPIDTIHGLCSRLLHENAVAAQVDPNFGVIEGTDAHLLIEETVRRSLLDRLSAEEQTAAELVSAFKLGPVCEAIVQIIHDRARMMDLLLSNGVAPGPEQVMDLWQDEQDGIVGQLLDLLTRSPDWLGAVEVMEQVRATDPSEKLDILRLERLGLAAGAANANASADARMDALCALREGSLPRSKPENWSDEGLLAQLKNAVRSFSSKDAPNAKRIDELLIARAGKMNEVCARLTSALAHEVLAALQAYDAAKRAMSVLDFEDLQLKVRDLWADREDVLKRYQRGIRHVLVDEFQDTNELQKQVLWPLCGGGAILFVVGDAKQSIYRFRNADVTVFNETRGQMDHDDGSQLERLAVNFRSTPAMTACINDLFGQPEIMGSDPGAPYEAFYEPLAPHREGGEHVALDLQVIVAPDGADEDHDAEPEDSSAGALREAEAARIAQRIAELVGAGSNVYDRQEEAWRPACYGDFGILFRATGDMPTYERALRLLNIPYYVLAGRGFYSRQEVRDVVNCLRALENTLDEVALVGVLRSPMFGLSDETLFWLSRTPGTWWERLQSASGEPTGPLANVLPDELHRAGRAADILAGLRGRKNRQTLSRLINDIVEKAGLSATLATRFGGDQMVSNLRKLADIARDVERGGDYSLRGLIERLQDMMVRDEREGQAPVEEEDSNVVKLLTIHSAKGLEWPIVIVPDLARGVPARTGIFAAHPRLGIVMKDPGEDAPWPLPGVAIRWREAAEELAESRRLFYVACTRARDRLILSSPVKNWNVSVERTALGWLARGLDLDLEKPCEEPIGGEGWTGQLSVLDAGSVNLPRPQRRSSVGGILPTSDPAAVVAGELSALAPPELVARITGQISPLSRDARSRARFNATELAAYLVCPRLYQLRYIIGVPEEFPAPPSLEQSEQLSPLELGELVHKVLQVVGSGGKQRLDAVFPDDIGLDTRLAVRARASLDAIRSMLEWYLSTEEYTETVSTAQRLRTEMPILFRADGAVIEGKVDALAEAKDGGLHLLDYKTGKRDSLSAGEHIFQLGLYCAGVSRARVGNLSSAAIVYLSMEDPAVVPLDTQDTVEGALARALEAIGGIRNGRHEPAEREHCAYCKLRWACDHLPRT